MIRNILIGLGLVLAALVGFILVNTFNYGGAPVGGRVELPEPPEVSVSARRRTLARRSAFAPSPSRAAIRAPVRKANGWRCMPGWRRLIRRRMRR